MHHRAQYYVVQNGSLQYDMAWTWTWTWTWRGWRPQRAGLLARGMGDAIWSDVRRGLPLAGWRPPAGARGDILGAHAHGTGHSAYAPRGEAVEHPVRAALTTGVVPSHTAPRVGHLLAPPAALHTRPALTADVRGERGGRPGRGVGGCAPPRKPTGGPDFHAWEALFSARGAGGVKAGRAGHGSAHEPSLAPREECCTRATG